MPWIVRQGVLCAALLGLSGPAVAAEGLNRDWNAPQRYYVETEVRLPSFMWFLAQNNIQARVVAFEVRAVFDCGLEQSLGRQRTEVACDIEDVSISAAPMPTDERRLQPILGELDDRLTGATLLLQVRHDGRIINVGLRGIDDTYRRGNEMRENLRLILSRAVAGLDFPVPMHGEPEVGTAWAHPSAMVMNTPSSFGTQGYAEVVHQIQAMDERTASIASVGQGVLAPQDGQTYETRYEGRAVFDTALGSLIERSWLVVATPTASAGMAEGFAGIPYVQQGHLVRLAEDERADVGASRELPVPENTPSALQQWMPLGESGSVQR